MLPCGCELKIVTESGGETSLFQSKGEFESADGGERVRYHVEDDEGELFYSEDFFENCRRGKCALKARFCEGAESEIILGSSDLTGKIPVRTSRYRLEKDETGRQIELCYELLGSKNIQTFLLKIQIVFFSEEK
ncbi:MAG: DUF1934 family protein [Clostridia bacterium]|nr:DUF1934 family protein [Clostridia bacterium]